MPLVHEANGRALLSRVVLRVAFALATTLSLGCLGGSQARIEKGEPVDSGRRDFDDYFNKVGELRDKVKGLDPDLFTMREPLVEAMDLDTETPFARVLYETRKRVGKAKDYGLAMNLLLTPQVKVVQERGELASDEKVEGLARAIEESATRALTTYREYRALIDRSAELDDERNRMADKLSRTPASFTNRDLVARELVAAGRVLRDAETKLLRDSRTIAHFLVGLADAADTGARNDGMRCDEQPVARGTGKPEPAAPAPAPVARPAVPRPVPVPRPVARPTPTRPQPTRPTGGDFEM
jgi:hypothetical protein